MKTEISMCEEKSEEICKQAEEVCKRAVVKFGETKQWDMAIEEFAELTKCLVKYRRYDKNRVWRQKTLEEVCDCYIMLRQIQLMLGTTTEEMHRLMTYKIKNLEALMVKDDPERGLNKAKK